MARIEKLSSVAAERIATSQVVTSICEAIRQLVDNSLDAGAKTIEVRVHNFGYDIIEVLDNGCGIAQRNFDNLCKPHSTSKLSDYNDFDKLATLGFRGEALNALCAMGTLSIFTKCGDDQIGTKMKFSHSGDIMERVSCAREIGTSTTVERLFETLPVRRKELERTCKKDFMKTLTALQNFALMRPDVKFICSNTIKGKKTVLISTPGNCEVREVIFNLFCGGKPLKDMLLKIEKVVPNDEVNAFYSLTDPFDYDKFRLTGYISNCEHGNGRSSGDRQYVFVNNRPIEYPLICRAANEVYQMFNKSRYPIFIMFLTVDNDMIDVNVTPDKKTVIIENEKNLLALIRSSVLTIMNACLGIQSSTRASVEDSREKSNNTSLPLQICLENTSKMFSLKRPSLRSMQSAKRPCPSSPSPGEKTLESFAFKVIPHETRKEDPIGVVPVVELEPECTKTEVLSQTVVESDEKSTPTSPILKQINEDSIVSMPSTSHDESQELMKLTAVDDDFGDLTRSAADSDEEVDHEEIPYDMNARRTQTIRFSMSKLKTKLLSMKQRKDHVSEKMDFRSKIDEKDAAESELDRHLKKCNFENMSIIGQFNKGFIICRLGNHLFIVDQHASDEKYNFEKLISSANLIKQPLIRPLELHLGIVQDHVIKNNLHVFQANGFDFDFQEDDVGCMKAMMTARPELLKHQFSNSDVEELVTALTEYPGQMYQPQKVRAVFASRACRKSIMIGDALDDRKMRKVVKNLAGLEQPWNCPHGRPTIRHLCSLMNKL